MKSRLLGAVFALVSFSATNAAVVGTVIGDASTGLATGAIGLGIDIPQYNVTFVISSYDSHPQQSWTFFGDLVGATNYSMAINSLLNDGGWTAVSEPPDATLRWHFYAIPYEEFPNQVGGTNVRITGGLFTDSWEDYIGQELSYVAWPYARFEAVPIPPAIYLFGSGLVGLVEMARRRKQS